MSYFEIQSLYAGYGQATILRDVSLGVDPGDAVAVVGRNGAGKSTLLLSLFGETTITGGRILIDGKSIERGPWHLTAKRGISISPQGRRILPNLSVRENLLLSQATRRPGHWHLDSVFDLFPILRERAHKPGTALSGGQQQMLAIGRALMANPEILVLDEPSEGLSPILVDLIADVLAKIRERGTGILLVEQHLELVRRATDTYLVLSKGEVVGSGRTGELDESKSQELLSL